MLFLGLALAAQINLKRTIVMGLSFSELVVVAVVFLVLFGPEKLPEIASAIGKLAAELKKSSDSLRREFYNSVYTPGDNLKSQVTDIKQTLLAVKSNVISDVKQIVTTPPAAPPSRGGTNGRSIRLTPEQREAASISGLTEEEYAANLAAEQKRRSH